MVMLPPGGWPDPDDAPDLAAPRSVEDRVRAYAEQEDDEFNFWIFRAPEAIARDGPDATFSLEHVRGVFEELMRFFLVRTNLRQEAGHTPLRAKINLAIEFEQGIAEPQDRFARPMPL